MAAETFAITLEPGDPVLSDNCVTCQSPTYLIPYKQLTDSYVRTVATVRFCPHCHTVDEP